MRNSRNLNPSNSFRLDVRAMPFPRTTASSGDDSFNTERLDEQNSAENIRSSMQKYLQSKQQHLRKASEQLQRSAIAIGPSSQYQDELSSSIPARSPSLARNGSHDDDMNERWCLKNGPTLIR